MRYFSASIRFVFLYISDVRELLQRIISLPQIFLFSFLFADLDIVFNALFFRLKSLRILYHLQHKRTSKTRYYSAKVFFVFLSFCGLRHRFKCSFSLPQIALYSLLFAPQALFLCRVISLPQFDLYSFIFAT